MYWSLYFRKSSTTARNFLRSASDVALFAYVVLTRYLPLDLVAEGRSQPVLPHERVQGREQLRAVLADGDGERAAGAHGDVLVDDEVRKDLLPELREVVVDDDGRDQAGVHHLEQVVVLEVRAAPS